MAPGCRSAYRLSTLLVCFAWLVLLGSAVARAAETATAEAHQEGRFLGAMPTVYPDWFKQSFLDFEEDIAEAAAQNKRLMLVFHQDGCPYCNQLVERNLAQKDISETVQRHFDVVAINMWGDREVVTVGGYAYTEKSLARALKVQFTPTILFFDEHGKIALRLNGYVPPTNFRRALEFVAKGLEQEMSYTSFLAENRPEAESKTLREQPFFRTPPYDLRDAVAADKPLAVFFEQAECSNCETLHDQVLSDQATRELIERFHVIQLDMWSDQSLITPAGRQLSAREWAQDLGVAFAPTIVLFNRQGEEVIRSEAYFKIFHTQSLFDYVDSGDYRDTPSFQRYLSARADARREQGVDVNIWD